MKVAFLFIFVASPCPNTVWVELSLGNHYKAVGYQIWITDRGSTTRFVPSLPISKAVTVFTAADGLNCCVQSMYQDKSGNMWWGTGQGLYRFDGTRFYQVMQEGPW